MFLRYLLPFCISFWGWSGGGGTGQGLSGGDELHFIVKVPDVKTIMS